MTLSPYSTFVTVSPLPSHRSFSLSLFSILKLIAELSVSKRCLLERIEALQGSLLQLHPRSRPNSAPPPPPLPPPGSTEGDATMERIMNSLNTSLMRLRSGQAHGNDGGRNFHTLLYYLIPHDTTPLCTTPHHTMLRSATSPQQILEYHTRYPTRICPATKAKVTLVQTLAGVAEARPLCLSRPCSAS